MTVHLRLIVRMESLSTLGVFRNLLLRSHIQIINQPGLLTTSLQLQGPSHEHPSPCPCRSLLTERPDSTLIPQTAARVIFSTRVRACIPLLKTLLRLLISLHTKPILLTWIHSLLDQPLLVLSTPYSPWPSHTGPSFCSSNSLSQFLPQGLCISCKITLKQLFILMPA